MCRDRIEEIAGGSRAEASSSDHYPLATLSVLESPGAEAQVNELRKMSIKLSKALNFEGIRSMVERVSQKNSTQWDAKDVESTANRSMQEVGKNDENIVTVETEWL